MRKEPDNSLRVASLETGPSVLCRLGPFPMMASGSLSGSATTGRASGVWFSDARPFSVDEIAARVFGDAAVVTARLTAITADGSVASQSRLTHVYVKRDGRWQLAAGQGTPMANR